MDVLSSQLATSSFSPLCGGVCVNRSNYSVMYMYIVYL